MESERAICCRSLEIALESATEHVEGMTWLERACRHRADRRRRAPEHRGRLGDLGVYRGDDFYRLDEVVVYEEFLSGLPTRLRAAARRDGSPLANLAGQLNYGELVVGLNGVRQAIAVGTTVGTTVSIDDALTRASGPPAERDRGPAGEWSHTLALPRNRAGAPVAGLEPYTDSVVGQVRRQPRGRSPPRWTGRRRCRAGS